MCGMETRMERYAKYRESIKRMAPEEFAPRKSGMAKPKTTNEIAAPEFDFSFDPLLENGGEKTNSGPYSLYIKKRKRWLIIKLVCLVVVAGAFVAWWFLMQGRK